MLADLQALDQRIFLAGRGQPPALVPFFHVLTVIGGGWGMVVLLAFLARRATRAATAWLLAAIVAQSAIVSLVKVAVRRVRPCDALAWCVPLGVCTPLGVPSPGGGSFPSGHAAGSFAFAAFVSLRAPRWAAPAILWAVLVAWSRVVLGVHYPTDILAGALLGTAVGIGFARASLRRRGGPSPLIPAGR